MIIRKANIKDLKDIDRIYVEGSIDEGKLQFPKVSKKEILKDVNKTKKTIIKEFRKEIKSKKNNWIVVEENCQIAGFGNAEIKKDKRYGMITMVYIDKKFRRRGIGIKISRKLIKWLKSKKVKYIESSAYINNKPSIKMQEKLGFKPISLKMRLK